MIILQVFMFYKTYHLVLRDSALEQPQSAPSVHPRVHIYRVYSFMNCFPTMPLNRTKLKYETMKLKTYEKFIWMSEVSLVQYISLE